MLPMLAFVQSAAPAWAADNQAPARTIVGTNTLLTRPWGVAKLADGSLAVANDTGIGNSVTVYAAGANGDATPTRTIQIHSSATGIRRPSAVAVLPDGSLAVGVGDSTDFFESFVAVYAADADGDVAPLRTITGLSKPVGLAALADGSLAVSQEWEPGGVRVYAPGANGAATPTRTITDLSNPYGLAALADGTLAVGNGGDSSVRVFAANADGAAAPLRTISGAATGLNDPISLAELADGTLAVVNATGNSVTVYAWNAAGNAAPLHTISGAATGLNGSSGLAVLPDGLLAVGNWNADSVTVYALPPGAPTGLTATPGDGQASIAFTAPTNTGGAVISNYEYSTNDGSTWTARSPAATTSPITITGLTNGTTYPVKLRAVNSAGAGTASVAVAVAVTPPCGPGLSYTTGQWLMLALPCTPTSPTVGGAFGDSPTANFVLGNYDNGASGWVMYSRDVTATPSAYVKLGTGTTLEPTAKGYWLKSGTAPVGGQLTIASGAATPATTGITGCQSANGCVVIPVQTVSGGNRYNLVGNPFPYAVDWSKVRVRVGGAAGTVYTPSQAAGLTGSGDANPPVMGKQIWIWNGTNYDNWDDTTNPGNLKYFQSFWVNVLPGAAGLTVELLIPAEASTHGRLDADPARALAAAPLPWYLGWLDWVAPPARAADNEWQVRLGVENRVTGWKDTTNLLGQKLTAQTGYDRHDLIGMAPFATPYLSLVLPHTDWPATADGQKRAGDYDTDFRPAQGNPPTTWSFELRASPTGAKVFLTWQGDPAILKRSRLVDLQTGQTLDPTATAYAQGYPVVLRQNVQRYQWRYLGH